MKYIFSTLFFLVCSVNTIFSNEIDGSWRGKLDVMGNELTIIFNITTIDNNLSASMDIPEQGAQKIPATISYSGKKKIVVKVEMAGIEYKGSCSGDSIVGKFKQGFFESKLTLKRISADEASAGIKRPQTPPTNPSYAVEDISFENKKADGILLAGTLTLSENIKTPHPVAILISGSGPQNRDEEILGHKPFAVLADYLTRQNIGVLRFDDRGCFESKGDFKTATTADFATDVEAAIDFLLSRKDIDENNIFLIGHSEGGNIASIVATQRKDVRGIVMLAGIGVNGAEVLITQTEKLSSLANMPKENIESAKKINREIFDLIISTENESELAGKIKPVLEKIYNPLMGMDKETFLKQQMQSILSPWFKYFVKYNPADDLEKVKCPVLALNGEKDMQVDADINLKAIEAALNKGGNKKITTKIYPQLNHLFQTCKTGSPTEYATIEETFSPLVMEDISNWIHKEIKE